MFPEFSHGLGQTVELSLALSGEVNVAVGKHIANGAPHARP